mmetsp:Transcript_33415/g.103539  ORF Transcript_33415/g.103539 Transcript_33415/m.103539 type:complete len:659 (-) Transcript_33415:110-2086(-)
MRKISLQASIADRVIVSYEGARGRDQSLEGHGIATFVGGTTYEGNFCGGMMEGSGTYTWPDGTHFMGEFRRNTITGKGIYKWPDGSWYEGAVFNGLRHGYGTMCGADNGSPCYRGDWHEGKRHGVGILSYNEEGSCSYRGQWRSNRRTGYGSMYYASGNIYEGGWNQDVKYGKGKMVWRDRLESYDGEWCNDRQNGTGEHMWMQHHSQELILPEMQSQLCNRYFGHWEDGLRHGTGTFYYANGAQYSGHWTRGLKVGRGVFIRDDGALYSGTFHRDRFVQNITKARLEVAACTADVRIYLQIGDLISEDSPSAENQHVQLQKVMLRYNSDLRGLYSRYTSCSSICDKQQNVSTIAMTSSSFFEFCRDVRVVPTLLPQSVIHGLLQGMFRQHENVINAAGSPSFLPSYMSPASRNELRSRVRFTRRPLLYREFIEAILRVAFTLATFHSPGLSVSDAFDMFVASFVRPLGEKTLPYSSASRIIDSTKKNCGNVRYDELISQVNNTLRAITSKFETLQVRPVVTMFRTLIKQHYPTSQNEGIDGSLFQAIRAVLSAYGHTVGAWERACLSIPTTLILCNAELAITEVARALVEVLASAGSKYSIGALAQAAHEAQLNEAEAEAACLAARHVRKIPGLIRYAVETTRGEHRSPPKLVEREV